MTASSKSNNTGNKSLINQNISNCDSSSGVSSSSATSLQKSVNVAGNTINGDGPFGDHQHYHQLWQDEIPNKEIKELDILDENCRGPNINVGNSHTSARSNAIGNHNGQIESNNLLNGTQSLNSENVNQKHVLNGVNIRPISASLLC